MWSTKDRAEKSLKATEIDYWRRAAGRSRLERFRNDRNKQNNGSEALSILKKIPTLIKKILKLLLNKSYKDLSIIHSCENNSLFHRILINNFNCHNRFKQL